MVLPLSANQPLVEVDCGSCRACCHSLIVLMPERGDDVSRYQTQQLSNGMLALATKEDGSCVYLGEDGCTIHPDHPAICKAFDCAGFYDMHTRAQRRKMLAKGQYDRKIFEAGRQRAEARFAARKRAVAEAVVRRVKERL